MPGARLDSLVAHIHRIAGASAQILTDRQLLERYASNHDQEAFAQLVLRHGPLVKRVGRRVSGNEQDADDVFQATFLVLARKADTAGWSDSIARWIYKV